MADSDAFFTPAPTRAYRVSAISGDGHRLLTFPSALETPHPENNTVYCRVFPGVNEKDRSTRAAVVVLPQWNADPGGHVGLSKLLALNGMTARFA